MKFNKNLILSDKDKRLRCHCLPLDVKNISPIEDKLIKQMQQYIDICYADQADEYGITSGIAVAGPQVGLMKQVIYIHFHDGEHEYQYLLANPVIKAKSVAISYIGIGEGCLSVKDKVEGITPRHARIIVHAYDLINHQDITIDASGLLSICLQHEIDHLSGVLYYDHINQQNPYMTKPEWIKI